MQSAGLRVGMLMMVRDMMEGRKEGLTRYSEWTLTGCEGSQSTNIGPDANGMWHSQAQCAFGCRRGLTVVHSGTRLRDQQQRARTT